MRTLIIILVLAGIGYFLYQGGYLNTADIGTIPEEFRNITNQESSDESDETSALSDLPGSDEPTTDDPSIAATVVYDSSGFSPDTVTIKVGETVRFSNERAADMWVASAAHPTHTVYPEKTSLDCLGSAFDACQSYENGEHWDFTFNEAGTWKYHNHRRASDTGTIIVEE